MFRTYTVEWVTEVDATGAREAAQAALDQQRDPDSIATVFTVYGPDGSETDIDLLEDDTEDDDVLRTELVAAAENGILHMNGDQDPLAFQDWDLDDIARAVVDEVLPIILRDRTAGRCLREPSELR